MFTSSKVKRHIASLEAGELFCRRDLLYCGYENAIDMTLYKLVQGGLIERQAYGVYKRAGGPVPTAEAVAEAKIAALGRTRQRGSAQLSNESTSFAFAQQLRFLEGSDPTLLVYEVNGSASTFRVFETEDRPVVTVKLKKKCARKMFFDFSRAGQLIKSLWKLGKDKVTRELVIERLAALSAKERKEFHSAHQWMTGWLSRIVHQVGPVFMNGAIQKESFRNGRYAFDGKLVLVPKRNPLVMQI